MPLFTYIETVTASRHFPSARRTLISIIEPKVTDLLVANNGYTNFIITSKLHQRAFPQNILSVLMAISVPIASALVGLMASMLAFPLEKALKDYVNTLAMHLTLLRGHKFIYRPVDSRSKYLTWQTFWQMGLRATIYAPLFIFSLLAGFSIQGVSVQPTSPLRTILYTACIDCEELLGHGNLIQARLALVGNRVTRRGTMEFWGGYIEDVEREEDGLLDSLKPGWNLEGETALLELNLTTSTAFQNQVAVRSVEKIEDLLWADYVVVIEGDSDVDYHLRGGKTLTGSLISSENSPVCQLGCTDEAGSQITVLDVTPVNGVSCEEAVENWTEEVRTAFSSQIVSAGTSFDILTSLRIAARRDNVLCNSNVRTLGSELAFLGMQVIEYVVVNVKSESMVVAEFRAIYMAGLIAPVLALLFVWMVLKETGRRTRLGLERVFDCVVDLIRGGNEAGVLEMKEIDGVRFLIVDGERKIAV